MSLSSRVVKLEDVDDDGHSTTSEDLATLVNSDPGSSLLRHAGKSGPTKSNQSAQELELYSSGRGDESRLSEAGALVEYVPSEAADFLRPYPEGWPKLPAVVEARDCTRAQTPAVNLASAHLELLQNIIDEWFRVMSAGGKERKCISVGGVSQTSSRRHLRFEDAPFSADLLLIGIGGKTDFEKRSEVVVEESVDDMPFLGAEEVVEEVINLLAKLENDRRNAHTEYKLEREKVKRLAARIDSLAEKRLDLMPAAVQSEHEACARDIYELQWHISYRGRIRDRTVARREVAEALRDRLRDEISAILQQSPMVREKLDMESDVMEKIRTAQEKTSDELAVTMEKCEKLQAKSDETHAKAKQERQYMADELLSLNKDLEKISAELERVRQQHTKFLEKIEKTKSEIETCELNTQVMKERNAKAMNDQKAAVGRVQGLKKDIHALERRQQELVEEMIKKQKKIDARKKAQGTVEAKLQKNIDQLESEYQFVHRIAQEFDLDIEDFGRKTEECEKQRLDDEVRIKSIKRSLSTSGEELQTIMKEYHKVEALHNVLSANLAVEEAKAKKAEEQLRAALAGLRKQVNDEKNARAMLEANIASDRLELAKSEEEGQLKKGKLENLSSELQKAVDDILAKVEDLRATREQRDKSLNDLVTRLRNCRSEYSQVKEQLTARKQDLAPEEKKLKDDDTVLAKKLDHLEWRSDMMKKKMEDMASASVMMTRAVSNTEKSIKELTGTHDELSLRYEAGKKSLASVIELVNDTTNRNRQHVTDHELLMGERVLVLEHYQKDLEDNHKSNTQLASNYRRLDNECMVLKDKLLNETEEALQIENSLKDAKQLCSLQSKMHSALCEYFKQRGLYMQTELDCMNNESYGSSKRIRALHEDIASAIDSTSQFLVGARDHTKARRMAEEAVKRQEETNA